MPYIKTTNEEENLINEESRYSFLSVGLLWLIGETLKLKNRIETVRYEAIHDTRADRQDDRAGV